MSRFYRIPDRSDPEVRILTDRALHGVDRPVGCHWVTSHLDTKEPPKRLLPQTEVFPPRKPGPPLPFRKKLTNRIAGFGLWLIDPLPTLPLPRIRTRKSTRFKGGWDSIAGKLLCKTCVPGDRLFVVGERTLSLVYVGPTQAEVAWSEPKEQLVGVELATWDSPEDDEATLRCHFTDGSWIDLVALGAGWKQFLDHLPTYDHTRRK